MYQCLHVGMCTLCIPGAFTSDPLELELGMAMGPPWGVRYQTLVLHKSSQCS